MAQELFYWHANAEGEDQLLAGPGWIPFSLA